MKNSETLAERFDAKWDPEPFSGCWLWNGCTLQNGYGYLWPNKKAHRVSWELNRGEIPKDLQVLHRCDVKSCVNPEHLFLGTHADNMSDMVNKGRAASGEKNASSKLSWEQVKHIRSTSTPSRALAKQFGVTHRTILLARRYILRRGVNT